MARTVVRRRSDGIVTIARPARWPWVLVAAGAAAFIVLPMALALVIVVPPVILALPMMALWVGVWLVFRRLDTEENGAEATMQHEGR